MVKNPAESILPEIAVQAVDVLSLALNSASRLLGEPLAEIRDMTRSEEGPSEAAVLALSSVIYAKMDALGGYFFPLPVSVTAGAAEPEEAAAEDGGEEESGFNIFTYILPGLAFLGILFIGEMAMRDVLAEQTAGTLSRALTTPLTPAGFLAGKMTQAFILCLACQALIASRRRQKAPDPPGLARGAGPLIYLSALLVGATGHWGGMLTFGEGYFGL